MSTENELNFSHRPVMLDECIENLAIKPDGIYVDGTAGGGGHSFAIASRLTTGRLIAIDQDEAAIAAAGARLAPLGERATVVRSNFRQVAQVCEQLGVVGIDGLLLDLATAMTTARARVRELYGKDLPGGHSVFTVRFEVKDVTELEFIRTKLLNIRDVIGSRRGQN